MNTMIYKRLMLKLIKFKDKWQQWENYGKKNFLNLAQQISKTDQKADI